MTVTADSTVWTADTICVTADGRVICIPANLAEAAAALDDLDAGVGAQVLFGTLDEAANALDALDADVISLEVPAGPGGLPYPRRPLPLPVAGVGYGVLPELEGEAHGLVIAAGGGVGMLGSLPGVAAGSIGVAGHSAAQLLPVRATAIGARGQIGAAVAVLKGLSIASKGTAGARGSGIGTLEVKGAAIGRHDDDEAAVMTFLLAA